MGAHAWWCLQLAGKPYIHLVEAAFFGEGGADLSVGGVAGGSSQYDNNQGPSKAFDKDPATGWHSAWSDAPARLWYQHPQAVTVQTVRIQWAPVTPWVPSGLRDIKLLHSNDGQQWSDGQDNFLELIEGSLSAGAQTVLRVMDAGLIASRPASLARLISPNSDQWSQPGSHPRQYRGVPSSRRNIHFGGNGQITGTVKEKGQPDQPLVREVLLYSENTHTLVASTWSQPDGSYRFERIDREQRYTVISTDYRQLYRAVIADNLKPEPMP